MGASLLSSTLQYSCKNVVSKPRRVLSAPTPPVQLQHIRNPLQRLEFHSLHHTGAPRLRVSTVSQVRLDPLKAATHLFVVRFEIFILWFARCRQHQHLKMTADLRIVLDAFQLERSSCEGWQWPGYCWLSNLRCQQQ